MIKFYSGGGEKLENSGKNSEDLDEQDFGENIPIQKEKT